MTGGLVLCTRARAPFGGHGLSHTVGRERCSRWRLLTCGWACVVCHLSTVSECHGVIIATAVRSERSISVACARRMDPKHIGDAGYA
jgi:hypothetical protein